VRVSGLSNVVQVKAGYYHSSTATYTRNYSLNTLTVTEENGRTTLYKYNPFGQEIEVYAVASGINTKIREKFYTHELWLEEDYDIATVCHTEYTYDNLGRIVDKYG